ncbi:LysM peptidoglycan-binding domain-containing protein [Gammaproteobacteria bacterium]|nr:LysM peptidoglycan-binding domain-containing protein [Gammaproteobacteria bacterium]
MSKFSDIFKKILPTIVSTYIPGTNDLTKAAIAAATSKATGGSTEDALLSGIGTYAAGKYGIPPMTGTSPIEYIVKAGDTLNAIAAANNTTADALANANNIADKSLIFPNQVIKIPGSGSAGGIPSASRNIFTDLFSGGGADDKGNFGKIGDIVGGITSNYPGGGMGMAFTGLLGKAAYDDYKRREGGLADTPQVSMDSLGRYQLANALGTGGTREEFGLSPAPVSLDFDAMNQPVAAAGGGLISRQYFSEGGIAELDMREGGESEGPGTGTSDDVPAMLSDGEFVMTAAATKGAGAYDLNKTKKGIELIKTTDSDRERGVTNMRELMNIFEAV